MLEIKKGNIFESDSEAIVNPVNTEGVMGRGLAYQFKIKYPKNFENYLMECNCRNFDIGSDLVYTFENDKIVINFPTKRSWKENSKIEYIQIGLKKLSQLIIKEKISSISIPPLGAGNGKLSWVEVKKILIDFEKSIDKKIKVIIYEPTEHEVKLSKNHLLLIKIILRSYDLGLKKEELTDLNFQKIIYLTDPKNYFKFYKYKKGPFSTFINVTYNELKKYSRVTSTKIRTIEKELEKQIISETLKNDEVNIIKGITLYNNLKKHFNLSLNNLAEIENKLELLTTVLFIFSEKKEYLSFKYVYEAVINWNERKAKKYSDTDINDMLNFLILEKKIDKNIFSEYQLISR